MPLNSDITVGYAKLDPFTFTSDLYGDGVIIEYGNGEFDFLTAETIEYTYPEYGVFTVGVRECDDEIALFENTVSVVAKPYVLDSIEFSEAPVSGFASTRDGQLFVVSLSSNCPPPLQVALDVSGPISPPVDELLTGPYSELLPKHYFTTDEVLQGGIVTLDAPSEIYVNGILCGWHDSFCFEYYDDHPGEKELSVTLQRTCNECFDIDWTYCGQPFTGGDGELVLDENDEPFTP